MTEEQIKAEAERRVIKRMITELYPNGLVGYVGDSYDWHRTISEIVPSLKPEIMARDGKCVWRPDSGVPEDIICGTASDYIECDKDVVYDVINDAYEYREVAIIKCEGKYYNIDGPAINSLVKEYGRDSVDFTIEDLSSARAGYAIKEIEMKAETPEDKGAVEVLWDNFGGAKNEKEYRELDSHVGLIYGDSITPHRSVEIFTRLADKSFAASNCVLGVGSFTYQHLTRDTLGFAVKATYGEVNGVPRMIAKEPKTDSGKKSAFGMMRVEQDKNGNYYKVEGLTNDEGGCLEVIYYEGDINVPTWDEVVDRLAEGE